MDGYLALGLFGLWVILQAVNGPLVDKLLGRTSLGTAAT
jgi:hypothetical protein